MAKSVPLRKRIFFGCEGASERSYVRWLQTLSDNRGKHLSLDGFDLGGGDPLSIVQNAVKKLREQELRKGKYAAKAVIFDSDCLGVNPERDAQIIPLLKTSGLTLLQQEEVHEAILLRHFIGCSKLRPRKGGTESRLKREWQNYTKPEDYLSLRDKLSFEGFRRMLDAEPEFKKFLGALIN